MPAGDISVRICKHTATSSTPGTALVIATDPTAANALAFRVPHTSTSMPLKHAMFEGGDINVDGMSAGTNIGTKSVQGSLAGDLKCGQYAELIEAVLRCTRSGAVISKTEAEFTSVASNSGASTFTLAGGNPVTEGYRVGDVISFGALTETANNGVLFTVLGFTTANNRVITVHPAPTTAVADNAFSMVSVGRSMENPSVPISTMWAIEEYDSIADKTKVTSEARISQIDIKIGADAMGTITVGYQGRTRQFLSAGNAPFFTNSIGELTTVALTGATASGVVVIDGVTQGVITSIDMSIAGGAETTSTIGTDLVVGVNVGQNKVTGSFTMVSTSSTAIESLYVNKTRFAMIVKVVSDNSTTPETMTFVLGNCIITDESYSVSGTNDVVYTMTFAADKTTAGSGFNANKIRIVDTEIV